MINALYCILPSGNSSEFSVIDAELIQRGISVNILLLNTGGRMYEIPAVEIKKLPKDRTGHFLGNNNSGHSIYTLSESEYNTYTAAGKWTTFAQLIGNYRVTETHPHN